MKGRTLREILEDMELDFAIRDRFKEERRPTRTVDDDDEYELPGMWDEED